MTNTVNEMDYAILDPAVDYIDTFDEVYSETVYENYDALSNTSNTTPEFNSPDAKELQSHFSYLNNYDYKPFKHVKSSSFSLPEKLNTLNISQASSKSPSPEFIYHNQEIFDNATINPQDIFTLTQEKPKKTDSKPPVDFEPIKSAIHENDELPKNYILPSSSSSPNLSSIFNQYSKDVDFKMNNECFNAIKVWLNNNELNDEISNETLVNPTGIIKTNQLSKRRNSIQMVNTTNPVAIDKRKRRKSTNSNANLNEIKSLLLNNELNEDTTKKNNNNNNGHINNGQITNNNHDNNKLKSPEDNGRNSSQLIDREEVLRQTIQSINFSQLEEEGKPFPCPDCSKQFKRSEHLKRHIRSVHSNIRPFHCKYCEKQFSRSDNLAQHLKTHYKLNSNGTTLIIYGNPNLHNRGGRRKNSSSGKKSDYIEEGTGTV